MQFPSINSLKELLIQILGSLVLKNIWRRGRKKHRFELIGHVGISPLKLNNSRDEIRKTMRALGYEPSSFGEYMDYFIQNSIQVEFDLDQRVSFIGVAPHRDTEVLYDGINVFENSAEEVFNLIRKSETVTGDVFQPEEHLFRQQIIALWDADQQYNRTAEEFSVWGQVGVGTEAYLKAIDKIKSRSQQDCFGTS